MRRVVKQEHLHMCTVSGLRVVQIRRGIKPGFVYSGCFSCLRVVQIRRGIKLNTGQV